MKYLATIKLAYDSSSKSFNEQKEAESWLDSQNNNDEHTASVIIFDDSWKEIDSYIYTQGAE